MIRTKAFLFLFIGLSFSLIFSCKKEEEETVGLNDNLLFERNYNKTMEPIDNDIVTRSIENGNMLLEHKVADTGRFYYLYYYKDVSRDYKIETSIKPLWISDDFQYGILFLMKNAYSHYYMYIKHDQFFIGYVYNFNYHILCDYTYSESIHTDGSTNIIVVEKDDKHLDFYINGDKVFEKDITNEIGDQFGYKFKCKGKVAIDYFRVYDTN